MRGKACVGGQEWTQAGITPAYAGKSTFSAPQSKNQGDHPRVCGEKEPTKQHGVSFQGSPPRMRGKAKGQTGLLRPSGITPAYAGKSRDFKREKWKSGDHPRVCGEKCSLALTMTGTLGSPPRMRGKGYGFLEVCELRGITPAYAGKRPTRRISCLSCRDHPRVCGEKTKKIPSHRPFQLHPVPVSFSFA